MTIDDAWTQWRNQRKSKTRKRRRMMTMIPVAHIDPVEARKWWIPRTEQRQ